MKAARSSPRLIIVVLIVISAMLIVAALPVVRAVLHSLQDPASSGPSDLRPIPVPAPLPPVAAQAPMADPVSPSAAKASPVPEAVPAPRPPSTVMKMAAPSVQDQAAASSAPVRISGPEPLAMSAALLICVLLGLARLRIAPASRSRALREGCL